MNIPGRFDVTVLQKRGDELVEKTYNVPFEFNFNTTLEYRASKGMEYPEFVRVFGGLKDRSFAANEQVCELFYYAIQEGCRICYEDMPEITKKDIVRFLNGDPDKFKQVLDLLFNQMDSGEKGEKKKKENP